MSFFCNASFDGAVKNLTTQIKLIIFPSIFYTTQDLVESSQPITGSIQYLTDTDNDRRFSSDCIPESVLAFDPGSRFLVIYTLIHHMIAFCLEFFF